MILNAPRHLVIWLDHKVARLATVGHDAVVELIFHNDANAKGHVHHHAGSIGSGHETLDKTFLEKIATGIGEAREILIVGPAFAKTELKAFLEKHHPGLARKVLGVETMEQATSAEVQEFAGKFFLRADNMAPNPK